MKDARGMALVLKGMAQSFRYSCSGRLVYLSLLTCVPLMTAYADDRLSLGRQLFSEGQLVEARRFFELYRRQYPENPVGVFYLGQIAFAEQRYQEAMENFEKAVQLDEPNSEYHLWLGRACGRLAERVGVWRQFFLARKVKLHFERAVALNPENLAARADLMEYYQKAPGFLGGSEEKAREQAREIAKRERKSAPSRTAH